MATPKSVDEPIPNGTTGDNSKDISDSESANTQEEVTGSDGGSDSPTPSVFSKFYEAKEKGIYDTRNQDVIAFIVDTITSDSKKEDRSVLMNAYSFLRDSRILDTNSSVASVNWSSTDANSRRVMHKLCEFYGLNHNIRGASEPNSMTIERKPDKFRSWDFSLHDLASHLQGKQNQQKKTILKRSVDAKTVSKTSGGAKDPQTQCLQSYDERQRNYNAVKQKLGIVSDESPQNSVMGRTQVIRRNNRLSSPDDFPPLRKHTLKQLPSVPPLMGSVYEPASRPYHPFAMPSQPLHFQPHCIVIRPCQVEQLSSADIRNAYILKDGRWLELANLGPNGEPVFHPCDERTSSFLNNKQMNIEVSQGPAYQTLTNELHMADGCESYNGTSKVIPSPMLPPGMTPQMISSMNGSFSAFPPQPFNCSGAPGLPVNGQSNTVGGAFVPNSPYFHPGAAPQQAQQHPPQSLTPQEHIRPSMSMTQLSQNTTQSAGDPSGATLPNGPMVYAAPTQQITLSDLTTRGTASTGPSGGQAPPGIILGIPSGQPHNSCTGVPPPPVTVAWPVGANGPPPSVLATASHPQFVTQAGAAVGHGHVLRPAAVSAVTSSASNFFAPISHKIPASTVIQQAPAGSQGMGFSTLHPNAAHLSQSAPRAFMGQPLMQVSMASNIPSPSYNSHRNGRRGPLSRQNSHNGANGAEGTNPPSGNGGPSVSSNPH